MRATIVSLTLFSMAANPVLAGSCKFAARQAYVAPSHYVAPAAVYHAAPVYKQHAVYEVATFLNLVKPSYYGQYVAPPPQMGEDEVSAAIKALSAELKDLKAQLALQRQPQPQQAPPPVPEPERLPEPRQGGAFRNLTNACAACHEAGVAAKKGGGLTLLRDGVRPALTGEQLGEVVDRVTTDDPARVMPPPSYGKLPPDVANAVIREALRK
jgi:cytochrome c